MSEWIPEEEWWVIVEKIPIVSVNLLVERPADAVLGKRTSEPASGEWFVPGGRLHKGERLQDTIHRSSAELGVDVDMQARISAHSNIYETSEAGCQKHYIAHDFHVRKADLVFDSDIQHSVVSAFEKLHNDIDNYIQLYINAAELGVGIPQEK